jgi:hypothetical protein
MDELQGSNRMARHVHFVQLLNKTFRHRHTVVPAIGHDHSLLFHSSQGVEAILGNGIDDIL